MKSIFRYRVTTEDDLDGFIEVFYNKDQAKNHIKFMHRNGYIGSLIIKTDLILQEDL